MFFFVLNTNSFYHENKYFLYNKTNLQQKQILNINENQLGRKLNLIIYPVMYFLYPRIKMVDILIFFSLIKFRFEVHI